MTEIDGPQLYVNRELSLIEFQRRVLDEANDPSVPLLERVRFLSIFGSNMDEFFMIRLAGLKQQVAAGVRESGPDGLTPAEQLAAVRRVANEIKHEAHRVWRERLMPALQAEGIRVLDYDALPIEARIELRTYFEAAVFPVLTPLAVDPSRPFPHISNLSVNLAVVIRDPPATSTSRASRSRGRFRNSSRYPAPREAPASRSSRWNSSSPPTWTPFSPGNRSSKCTRSGSRATPIS